jgi:hypothetical protein
MEYMLLGAGWSPEHKVDAPQFPNCKLPSFQAFSLSSLFENKPT